MAIEPNSPVGAELAQVRPDIRHHQQDHAQIWVTPLDGDKFHVALGNRRACTSIVLTSEICASLFTPRAAPEACRQEAS